MRFDPRPHPRQLAAPGLGERFIQPCPRRGFWEVAGRRLDLAVGPVRADPPLDLAAVGQPVLRVPLRAAFALDLKTCPLIENPAFAGFSWNTPGGRTLKPSRETSATCCLAPEATNQEASASRAAIPSAWGNRQSRDQSPR